MGGGLTSIVTSSAATPFGVPESPADSQAGWHSLLSEVAWLIYFNRSVIPLAYKVFSSKAWRENEQPDF